MDMQYMVFASHEEAVAYEAACTARLGLMSGSVTAAWSEIVGPTHSGSVTHPNAYVVVAFPGDNGCEFDPTWVAPPER